MINNLKKNILRQVDYCFHKSCMYMPTVMVASSRGMNLNISEPKGPNKDVGTWSP